MVITMNLSVISFNIRNCNDKNGHSVAERIPRIFSILKEENSDIIGLQEVRPHWEQAIKENLLDGYEMFLKYRNNDHDVEAAPIFWKKDKFTLIKKGNFWFSDTPETESFGWDELYNCYRMCSYVILKENQSGKVFTYMNTHYGFGDNCQTKSSELIKEYADKISCFPTIITGDFNMTPQSVGYKEITKYFTDVNTVTANYTGITYHGYSVTGENGSHIDYCFINSKISPKSYKLLDKTFDGKFPSDHFGLKIELEL